jgi:hypothetical protein
MLFAFFFFWMAACRLCSHATDKQHRLIFGSSFCLKQQVDQCCTFCLRAYIHHTSETSDIFGCLILGHCIIQGLDPRF